jgi:hypothetical protein
MRNKLIAILTVQAFLGLSLMAPVAQAGIVTTSDYLQQTEVEAKRADILTSLQRDEVQAKLLENGVDPGVVEMRVAALSDAEVMQMAEQMDDLPAGGVLGTIVAVLVILLLLELLGVTDIFASVGPA